MSRLCSPEKVEWMEKIWSSFTLLTKDWLISILFGLFLVNLRYPLCRVRNGCLFRLLIVKSFSNSFTSMICRPSLMIVMYYNSLIKININRFAWDSSRTFRSSVQMAQNKVQGRLHPPLTWWIGTQTREGQTNEL